MYTPEQFWNWFKDNNKAYTFLDSVDNVVKDKLLDEFEEKLHAYCDKLFFEMGGLPDEDQELIITAEGNSDYFDKVEELINVAPQIDRWQFTALKPAIPGHFKSTWGNIQLDTNDLWFLPLNSKKPQGIAIRIYIKNHDLIKDDKHLTQLVWKMLDTILGEKSMAYDINYFDTDLQPDDPEAEDMYPILELPDYIRWVKSKTQQSSS